VFFCTVGFINAFGVFEEYYAEHQLSDKSPSTISWLGSFNIFIMFAGTFPVGYLNDKYGHGVCHILLPFFELMSNDFEQTLLRVGSVITVFALFMTSLCKEYYQFFLAQALLMGIGIAIVMLPAFAIVPRHFVRNRSAALGICVSGSSLGGVIWPIILRNVLYKVGFGWGVRISAFIMLPLLAVACLTIRLPHDQAHIPKPKPDLTVVKNLTLVTLAMGLFFIFLGLFSPFFYMTTYMVSLSLDTSMAFYIVSIINATSLFGRIIPGIFADRLGPFNVLIIAALSSGITCACWTKATSLAGIIVLSAVYGFTSGVSCPMFVLNHC
jgi:MFS family permease